MIRVILAPNDVLTPFDLRAQNFRAIVEFSTCHRGQKNFSKKCPEVTFRLEKKILNNFFETSPFGFKMVKLKKFSGRNFIRHRRLTECEKMNSHWAAVLPLNQNICRERPNKRPVDHFANGQSFYKGRSISIPTNRGKWVKSGLLFEAILNAWIHFGISKRVAPSD